MTATVLGIPVSAARADTLATEIVSVASPHSEASTTILYANPHVLNTAYRNPALHSELRRATTVYVDGTGVRLGAWLLGDRLPPRLTAADWLDDFCSAAATAGRRVYLLGGADGVAARAAAQLTDRHRTLQVVGTHHGFLTESSSAAVVGHMNDVSAEIVLVGMGTPTQELWIGRHREEINAPVVWAVGALLDFVVGEQRRAPPWLRRTHLEWLWRLGTDPVRLWRRYLIGNPLFVARVLRQRFFGLPERFRLTPD